VLENTLQRKIQKFLKDKLPKAVIWKNHGNQYSVIGLPDIMCVYKGNIVCIEVKIPGNKPTKLQEVTLKKLEDAGAICCVAYSVADVEKLLIENKILSGGTQDENKQKII